MTAFYVMLSSLFELFAIALLIWGFYNESKVAKWERKQWARLKRFIRRQLRKSDKIVAWAEKPTKHGRPDGDFIGDPGYTATTDHTREAVPLLVLGKQVKPVNMGTRASFADIAATVAQLLDVELDTPGQSFAEEIL